MPNSSALAQNPAILTRGNAIDLSVSWKSNESFPGILEQTRPLRKESRMTSAELILVSVTSALVAVLTMLAVATLRRARMREEDERDEQEP
jgi:hypothetical protein